MGFTEYFDWFNITQFSAILMFTSFVNGMIVYNPNIVFANQLASPCWLRMLQVIHRVVELRDVCELYKVQAPNNVSLPLEELKATPLSTTQDL